jgi:hypothetical protein
VRPHWFSNKGQMLQALFAAIACLVGLVVAYYTLVEHEHSAAPLYFVIGTAIVACLLLFVPWRPSPSVQPHEDASIAAAALLSPLKPSPGTQTPAINYDSSFKKFTCRLGDAYAEERRGTDRLKVIVHSIEKNSDKPLNFQSDYVAEVEVQKGGLLYPGEHVKKVSTNRFIIPATSDPFRAEQSAIFSFSFAEKHILFFGLYIEHINPNAKEIPAVYFELRGVASTTR